MSKFNQKGNLQLVFLIIVLVGIALGVYLAQQQQIFKPRASTQEEIKKPEVGFRLSSSSNTLKQNEEITVSVNARSDPDYSNMFVAKLSYPTELLELTEISFGIKSSFIKNWIDPQDIERAKIEANKTGKLTLAGAVPNPGYQSVYGQPDPEMAILRFKALKNEGVASITFDEDSSIFRNSDNADLLKLATSDQNYQIVKQGVKINLGEYKAPETPKPSSSGEVQTITYNLSSGWNLIGIPLKLSLKGGEENQLLSKEEFLRGLGYLGNQNNCTQIFENLDEAIKKGREATVVTGGKAYFVNCLKPGQITLSGTSISSLPKGQEGQSLISLPKGYGKKASEVLREVSTAQLKCFEIDKWDNGGWKPFADTLPDSHQNNFTIKDTEGYVVKCGNPNTPESPTSPLPTPPDEPSPRPTPKPPTPKAIDMDINGDNKIGTSTKADGTKDKSAFYQDIAKLNSLFNSQCKLEEKKTAIAKKGDLNGDNCVNSFDWSLYLNEALKNGWV